MSGDLPAAFGCAAVKDRTGVLTALIQSLLGVDRAEIARHYAAAAPSPERLAPILRRWKRTSGALSPGTRAMLDAPPATITATLDYVAERFGGVTQYLAGSGLDPLRAGALRRALLTPA
ncbi:MAG TPA: tyrosine-protein phosphatase [Acidimicrobiia bacterium]